MSWVANMAALPACCSLSASQFSLRPVSSSRNSNANSIRPACSPGKRASSFARPIRRTFLECRSLYVDDNEDYLVDAPVSIGDGFSFLGGKYSDDTGPAAKWFARGKMIDAYAVEGDVKKVQEPFFGLAMGDSSQLSEKYFRWFYIDEGDPGKPTVLLVHGFPSQAYSFRKVIPLLSADFHIIAFDWLGFGFSDKPQPNYGFNYTMEEYTKALASLIESLDLKRMNIVCQGFSAPIVMKYASMNRGKVDHLVFMNPPVTEQHATLPSSLSIFSNFLVGEIFAQDPLKAGENPLNECGPYLLDENDAMVYRRPYLTSGSAGFALTAITKALKKDLKGSTGMMREILSSDEWNNRASIIWGMKDRWLDFKGVQEFANSRNLQLVQLPEVGHHAQEDFPEEVGPAIRTSLKRPLFG